MAVLELTLLPTGTGSTSVSPYIRKAYEVAKAHEEIRVELNPMGTNLEGDIDVLLSVVREMQEAVFAAGVDRVYSVIKIDDRRDKESNMDHKIEAVKGNKDFL